MKYIIVPFCAASLLLGILLDINNSKREIKPREQYIQIPVIIGMSVYKYFCDRESGKRFIIIDKTGIMDLGYSDRCYYANPHEYDIMKDWYPDKQHLEQMESAK